MAQIAETNSPARVEYEPVIGLETHAQLLTESKMFCRCSARYAGAPPNSLVCPICLGMPGVLPVINKQAVDYTVMVALALNCHIAEFCKFDRKNYSYPDLMKGYQISQYDQPISYNGWVNVPLPDGTEKRVGITRVHLEEDVAKLFHYDENGEEYSLMDVNRSGVPLMEIVSEPDMRSAEEARIYLMKLRTILLALGVNSGRLAEGAMRFDVNISVRPKGEKGFPNPKVEIKNLNSFRGVYRALLYETERQIKAIESGEPLIQETRGWNETKGITVSQRSKEEAHDYRYFPEPDLPPLVLTPAYVEGIRQMLPELPDAKEARFAGDFGLPRADAALLANNKPMADFFEEAVRLSNQPKTISNWMVGELTRLLNTSGIEVEEIKITPEHLVEMLKLIDNGTISSKLAKTVFEEMFTTGNRPADIVAARGLTQISDTAELERVIDEVLANNPKPVADYKAGKQASVTFLVGQVMKATKGRASPPVVNQLLREKLQAL